MFITIAGKNKAHVFWLREQEVSERNILGVISGIFVPNAPIPDPARKVCIIYVISNSSLGEEVCSKRNPHH